MVRNKTALVVGASGQDGSYLADLLVSKGYRVVGIVPPPVPDVIDNLSGVVGRVEIVACDVRDDEKVTSIIAEVKPDEVYNFAGTTNVADTWDHAVRAADETGLAVVRILEAIRKTCPTARYFQANSSEMFGRATVSPQNESTPFDPVNPYAAAKVYAHFMVRNYRVRYGLFACSGILFNHESPRRPPLFVTSKIARGAARVKLGLDKTLELGSLDARRDWGFAGDFVEAIWAMLQHDTPEDFVIGTGQQHQVGEFCELAFARVGLDYRDYVTEMPGLVRTKDYSTIVADPSKARDLLGWTPRTSFAELVASMVDSALARP